MKTILITGASSGFGLATAQLLAKEKYKLILLARRKERLDELKSTLQTEVYTASVDVTDRQQVQDFFANLPEEFRDIDVVINNAGLALGMAVAQESSLDDWERMVDTNIKGVLYMTRAALDVFMPRNKGMIINIGSVAGEVPYKGGNIYSSTKAFVRHFSRNLRTDLLGTHIKVACIEPAAAETEFALVRFRDQKMAKDYYQGWNPLKPEDIANTIKWIIDQPEHVNIDNVELMSMDQTFAGLVINKAQ